MTSRPSGTPKISALDPPEPDPPDPPADGLKPWIGWPAAAGKSQKQFGFDTDTRGQTTKLSQLMPLLASNRQKLNLGGYYYYTWMSSYKRGSVSPFAFSGLLRLHKKHVCAQPAFSVFRRNALSEQGQPDRGKTPRPCHR